VSPQSTIIVRFAGPVGTLQDADSLFRVTGTISGTHQGSVIVSEGETVIFKPAVPFAWDEDVQVSIATNAISHEGDPASMFSFTFHTSRGKVEGMSPFAREFAPVMNMEPTVPKSLQRSTVPPVPDSLPSDFPSVQVTNYGDTTSDLLFVASFAATFWTTPYLMILRTDGSPVFYRAMANTSTDFKIQPNGLLTYFSLADTAFFGLDSDYVVVDTFRCTREYQTDIHELRILPNGHYLLLADDFEPYDMSKVVPNGMHNAIVGGDIIEEFDSDKNLVFVWRTWDHFAVTDATHEDLTTLHIDPFHANALELDADGNILLSCRHLDEITKINHVTGDIMWRWGGKHNQFTFINDTLGFSHQHALRRITNGDFTLFDNGNYHTPPFSRALEYAVNETTMTATLVWQYRNSPDYYGDAMGYVQRLQNGNTLICWGLTNPNVTVVKPDGTKVYELSYPSGIFTYRAYRLSWAPGLIDAVTPPAATGLPSVTRLDQNYPNPFNPNTVISGQWTVDSRVKLVVYDVLGREVAVLADGRYPAGKYNFTFDGSNLSSGVYFCRLVAGNYTAVRKMALLK